MTSATIIAGILIVIILIIFGFAVGYFSRKNIHEKRIKNAKNDAEEIISNAKKNALTQKKEILLKAQDESHKYQIKVEEELKQQRLEIQKQSDRLIKREEKIDRKENILDKKEQILDNRENKLTKRQQKLESDEQQISSLVKKQQQKLSDISKLSLDEAREKILSKTKEDLSHDRAVLIRNSENDIKLNIEKYAHDLVVDAIQRCAADVVSEATVTVVNLPNNEMKGRIIGREGRNIRTLETLTGIDIIIDDTPEAVVLSGYDPIRREIAHIALDNLIKDGRIHPAKIEEMVDKARKEVDERIREIGEQAIFELGISNMHPDLIKILGRLHFRTSYGQNVLDHSIQVAKLAGVMASELGENVSLAKRAGLLHDIGKALDHEVDGSHVEIGVDLTKKYNESPIIVNTIASHHGDVEPISSIAVLVATADSISAARPGARSESLENYIHRIEKLESISNNFIGVDHSFAIQAGREIRVIVKPEIINDDQAIILAHDIKKNIERELEYPGHIKVTVIRETRTVEYAK